MYKRGDIIPMIHFLDNETDVLGDIDQWMTLYYETGDAAKDWEVWRYVIDEENATQLRQRFSVY